ncbi:MAG: hypothetical protein HY445_00130 [Candidatus Niyogibacteria bacterium]|nr:hypothetical protein [Candidatus Niyogibacteria bacterium]
MNIIRHEDIGKDLRNLRRFQAPLESLEAWERFFCLKGLRETPGIDLFHGFGQARVYKARVVPLQENVGKSKGYRAVFQMTDEENCKILVFSRHGIYKSEQELINLVKERIS